MWFHSLKARQTIRRVNTRNNGGIAVSLEYSDKKIEVHHLKREGSPLVFDEGNTVIFVSPKDGCVMLVVVSVSVKGKSTFELRTWEITSSFIVRDICVQDVHYSVTNDGKTRALLSVPDVSLVGYQNAVKADAFDNVMAIALDARMVFIWQTTRVDNGGLNCEIVGVVDSTMSVQDVLLLQPSKDHFPELLVGESGGFRIWKKSVEDGCDPTSAFKDTFCPVAPIDAGTTLISCQDFQRVNRSSCIFTNTVGNLYLFNSSKIANIQLPVSSGGHGLFAVEHATENSTKVTLAVVDKGNTINLYHLEDILKSPDSQHKPLIPYHGFFSMHAIGAISFLQKGSLSACALSSRTLSMWVGI